MVIVFGKNPFRSLQEYCGCVASVELYVSVSVNSWSCRALCYYLCSWMPIHHWLSLKGWSNSTDLCRSLCTESDYGSNCLRNNDFSLDHLQLENQSSVSTFNYIYLLSCWFLQFCFHTCSAPTISVSQKRTIIPTISLQWNLVYGYHHSPCDRKFSNLSMADLLRCFWLRTEMLSCLYSVCAMYLSPTEGCYSSVSQITYD